MVSKVRPKSAVLKNLDLIKYPRYIICKLNPQSVIARPDHNKILDPSKMPPDAAYQLNGYAYGSGGRRASCVEISWDDGHSFELGW